MSFLHSRFFFFLLLFSFSVSLSSSSFSAGEEVNQIHRRILHQPLFPDSSPPPPPDFQSTPPPPDQPFFPENPSTPDQPQLPPPPPPPASSEANGGLPIPTATTQQSKPGAKLAIAISVGVVTLGMLSALAFFLYRHKAKHASDTQKLVTRGGGDAGSRRFHEDPLPPTSSTFLYMGTVEPSREPASDSIGPVNTSPYRKLNSANKRSDRYRPSPELQPLPPLSKPPQQHQQQSPSALSPSASSSSDEECRDTAFYTPHGSAISSDDGYYTAFPRSVSNSNGHSSGSIPPHSKRTSPKSKFGTSAGSRSPEMKHVIIPSIKQKPPPVQPPPFRGLETDELIEIPYPQNKPKFSQPPPPPNRAAFQAITTQDKSPLSTRVSPRRSSPTPHLHTPPPPPPPPLYTPPPPPPPPPRPPQIRPRDFQIPRKLSNSEATKVDDHPRKLAFKTPSPQSKAVKEEEAKSVSAGTGEGDTDPSRPKLKPLHWDKVRASSDRATVWDQLKSSSFQCVFT